MSLRRPGGRWRLLVHEWVGKQPDGTTYSKSHDVEPNPPRRDPGPYGVHHELPANCEFDELVVGSWLHIEQMDTGTWWMNIGGVTVHVTADREGKPKHVTVHGPDDYGAAIEGCKYEIAWSWREGQ